jgi:hypothetical protein
MIAGKASRSKPRPDFELKDHGGFWESGAFPELDRRHEFLNEEFAERVAGCRRFQHGGNLHRSWRMRSRRFPRGGARVGLGE